jgi:hypothetical protein
MPLATQQEEVMGQPFPTQHPAVVLRSHFKLVSWLLAVAMAAVVALSVAVVIVANDGDEVTAPARSADAAALPNPAVHAHPRATPAPAPGVRYDGGPDEGTRAIIAVPQAPDARYDGGPDEGTRAIATPAPGPAPERTTDAGSSSESTTVIPQGPGGPR